MLQVDFGALRAAHPILLTMFWGSRRAACAWGPGALMPLGRGGPLSGCVVCARSMGGLLTVERLGTAGVPGSHPTAPQTALTRGHMERRREIRTCHRPPRHAASSWAARKTPNTSVPAALVTFDAAGFRARRRVAQEAAAGTIHLISSCAPLINIHEVMCKRWGNRRPPLKSICIHEVF